ncbi:transglutaminase family protein [Deinococcus sonorensis]|uniref:Transglutaminase family protein n=2 Tax=Deinococcus sonorensis TaxID=309891 RepID=A0AAU7UC62_9DEIO
MTDGETTSLSPQPRRRNPDVLRVRAGFEFEFELSYATPMLFVVEPRDRPGQRIVAQRRELSPDLPLAQTSSYMDAFGNVVWRVLAPPGRLRITHDLLADVPSRRDPVLSGLPGTPVERLPDELLQYLLPSRYVDSDLLTPEAWQRFGSVPAGWMQVQAICDHLHGTLRYGAGSTSATTASQAYQSGVAVCRDFAHLGVAYCRALNIPARYVCGYLPDVGVPQDGRPMDFHAWFEAWVDGAWRTFDARHNVPRAGRVLIATGRDASDTAFNTAFGNARLVHMRVWADEVDGDAVLPAQVPTPAQANHSTELAGTESREGEMHG